MNTFKALHDLAQEVLHFFHVLAGGGRSYWYIWFYFSRKQNCRGHSCYKASAIIHYSFVKFKCNHADLSRTFYKLYITPSYAPTYHVQISVMWHSISSLYYVLHRLSHNQINNTHSVEHRTNYVQDWDVDPWAKHSTVYRLEVWNSFSGENRVLMINSKQTFRRDGIYP